MFKFGNKKSKKGTKTISKKAVKRANMFKQYYKQLIDKHITPNNELEDYDLNDNPFFTKYPSY